MKFLLLLKDDILGLAWTTPDSGWLPRFLLFFPWTITSVNMLFLKEDKNNKKRSKVWNSDGLDHKHPQDYHQATSWRCWLKQFITERCWREDVRPSVRAREGDIRRVYFYNMWATSSAASLTCSGVNGVQKIILFSNFLCFCSLFLEKETILQLRYLFQIAWDALYILTALLYCSEF